MYHTFDEGEAKFLALLTARSDTLLVSDAILLVNQLVVLIAGVSIQDAGG